MVEGSLASAEWVGEMRPLEPADGEWHGTVCPECKGINPEWYDEGYHGLPECEGRYHDGHRDGCSFATSQPETADA
jgi:hypothetical protein